MERNVSATKKKKKEIGKIECKETGRLNELCQHPNCFCCFKHRRELSLCSPQYILDITEDKMPLIFDIVPS